MTPMNPLFLPAAGTSGELSRWYVHKKKAATIKSHFWLYLPTQTLHLAKPLQINLQSHSLIPKCVISLSLRPAPWHPWKNPVKNPWWIPIAFPRWKAVQTLHLVGGFNPPPQKREVNIFVYIEISQTGSFPIISPRILRETSKKSWNSYLEMILFDTLNIFQPAYPVDMCFFFSWSQQLRVHQSGRSSCELASQRPIRVNKMEPPK